MTNTPISDILFSIHYDDKIEEAEIIQGFLQRLEYETESLDNNREKPDLKINIQGKSIGVEITKYFSDRTRKGSKTQ